MKKILLLLCLILLSGCSQTKIVHKKSVFTMYCIDVGNNIQRCENIEEICYKTDTKMSCVYKYDVLM